MNKSYQKQEGSTTVVVIMMMLSFLIFTYQVYDLSKAYLTSLVSLNVSDEVADLYLIGDNSTQNKTAIATKISNYSGISFSSIKEDITYSTDQNVTNNEYFVSNVGINTKITPDLTKDVVGNKEFYNETKIQKIKKFADLNVVLVVSDSSGASSIISKYKNPMKDALTKLMDNTNSTLSIIPFGYRVKTGGRCYSVIERGDGFNFPWWEKYYGEDTSLNNLNDQLETENRRLNNINKLINTVKNSISETKDAIETETDPATKDELEDELDDLQNNLINLADSKDDVQDQIDSLEDEVDDQQETVNDLENTSTYKTYHKLAEHYVKKTYGGEGYSFFDDFTDSFLDENNFSFDKDDALDSAVNLDELTKFYDESVKDNSFFADEDTCPNASLSLYKKNMNDYNSTFNKMTKNAPHVSLIQGLVMGMKVGFSGTKDRTVIIYLIDQNDDYLTEQDEKNKTKTIASLSCKKSRDSYIDDIAAKNVFLTTTEVGKEHIEKLGCTNNSLLNGELNIINSSEYPSSEELSERILYELLQEGSSAKTNLNLMSN